MSRELVTVDEVYPTAVGTFDVIVKKSSQKEYSDEFGKELFSSKKDDKSTLYSQLAFYGEVAVGAVKARIQDMRGHSAVVIDTLAVLEAYRGKGVGTKLLDYVEKETKPFQPRAIYVTVAASATGELQWYQSHGFELLGDKSGSCENGSQAERNLVKWLV
ncbi:AAL102Cp [Eremothecium gossypii ATCC 10895]|uniref:AAL102Cp n=1 Tax=Eremothecium gossypii (strain ATCC 10895 / CBS 109.51 / FGSC 9923 / NRRL Y-1056) TaxID=284811 RepID=Q75F30_EREGS|nr:AAL102Cp [Eremothecium gossypii ATCC 10895]AAS50264.1 AAL102Cp [Eremothecium gossypii ATCC 10895]AEY94549.1 FAAL102Cp [Eremothecium gossypii FDAG1]